MGILACAFVAESGLAIAPTPAPAPAPTPAPTPALEVRRNEGEDVGVCMPEGLRTGTSLVPVPVGVGVPSSAVVYPNGE